MEETSKIIKKYETLKQRNNKINDIILKYKQELLLLQQKHSHLFMNEYLLNIKSDVINLGNKEEALHDRNILLNNEIKSLKSQVKGLQTKIRAKETGKNK